MGNRTIKTALSLALALALSACQQQSAPPAATSTNAKPATPPASTAADSIGVAECDNYLSKYEACLNSKVPAESRAAMKQGLDQTRSAWKSALSTPGGKEGLASACKQMLDSAKTSMSAFGCTDF